MIDLALMGPDGSEIEGTYENIPGTCGHIFVEGADGKAEAEADGTGTDVWWDDQTSETIEGVLVFRCDERPFLQHHLISQSEDPLPAHEVALMMVEVGVGRALEAARQALSSAFGDTRAHVVLKQAVTLLEIDYAAARNAAAASVATRIAILDAIQDGELA